MFVCIWVWCTMRAINIMGQKVFTVVLLQFPVENHIHLILFTLRHPPQFILLISIKKTWCMLITFFTAVKTKKQKLWLFEVGCAQQGWKRFHDKQPNVCHLKHCCFQLLMQYYSYMNLFGIIICEWATSFPKHQMRDCWKRKISVGLHEMPPGCCKHWTGVKERAGWKNCFDLIIVFTQGQS